MELFSDDKNSEDVNLICKICGTPHVKTCLDDIPEDKLIAQRKRYNEKISGQYKHLLSEFTLNPEARRVKELMEMFGPVADETEIIEADAGQKKLNEIAQMKRQKEIEAKEQRKQEVINECLPFKNMGRNDVCTCGSGKKYKKCCMDKIEGYLLKYHLNFNDYAFKIK